jgi:hypothetical protein
MQQIKKKLSDAGPLANKYVMRTVSPPYLLSLATTSNRSPEYGCTLTFINNAVSKSENSCKWFDCSD